MKPFRICMIRSRGNLSPNLEAFDALFSTFATTEFIVSKIDYKLDKLDSTPIIPIIQALDDFKPEVILLINLSSKETIDLAKNIREQGIFLHAPIIRVAEKPLEEPNLDIDGFISLPIQHTEQLIATIKKRIVRVRNIDTQMIRDSLTGLLNHAQILEQLKIEIARAQRERSPLAFAMLDIDQFKTINDTYGHIAGDGVIEKVATLFEARLRKSDSIGRYGGDEFAIILPKSTAHHVYPILYEIKESFAGFMHPIHHTFFTATFSMGIADLSANITNVTALIQAADNALYQAKDKGRNQIIIAN